jgi:hypothetical protein
VGGGIFPEGAKEGQNIEKFAITLLTLCVQKLRIFLLKKLIYNGPKLSFQGQIVKLHRPEMLDKCWQHCPAAALGGCGGGRGMTVELLLPEISKTLT